LLTTVAAKRTGLIRILSNDTTKNPFRIPASAVVRAKRSRSLLPAPAPAFAAPLLLRCPALPVFSSHKPISILEKEDIPAYAEPDTGIVR
jgi:hypothetical protein